VGNPILRLVLAALLLAIGSSHVFPQQRNLGVAATDERRVALVIGNDSYSRVKKLDNARADARAMAKALEAVGFKVTLRTDANEKTMREAVRTFKSQLSGGDIAVFFFSGHGVQLGSTNYLLPVDITSDNEDQVKDDSLPLQRVLDDLQEQKTKFSLAIVDACRDNPFRSKGRAIGGRGLAPTTAATGQMIIFSAGVGQQALDRLGNSDTDPNGVFTRVFLKEMERPSVSVDRVLRSVRDEVVRLARSVGSDQVPALYDQVVGDFYFRQGEKVASSAPLASAPAPVAGQFSVEDLKNQQESRAQWEKWQREMKGAFDQTAALALAPDLQAAAWGRFLETYAQDNPNSGEAAELRAEGQRRKQQAESEDARQSDETARKRREKVQVAIAAPSGQGLAPTAVADDLQRLAAGRVFRDCDVCPEMVVVPAGTFSMGEPPSEIERANGKVTQHKVTISRPFAVGKYVITFDEWDACVREGGCANRAEDKGWGRGRRPVINVSWKDAKQYTVWLSRKTGKGYRLPSEAEWEYMARAGTTTPFYTGTTISRDEANIGSKPDIFIYFTAWRAILVDKTVPVGSYPPNPFGIYDVIGNVWQWTEDCWSGDPKGAPSDGSARTGNDCGGRRVQRGWGWIAAPDSVADRQSGDPNSRGHAVGFRVTRAD